MNIDETLFEHRLIRSWRDKEEPQGLHLDIREYLMSGGEPYSIIMAEVAELKDEGFLILHAPFEPKPLVSQLNSMGYETFVRREGPDHYSLGISRQANSEVE